MGVFDIFKAKKPEGRGGAFEKWAANVGSKKAQVYDRQEALQGLSTLGTSHAAEALLRRFLFSVDPSITDQEEKEHAFQGIAKAGREALPAIRAYADKSESLGWPIRLVREILPEGEVIDELTQWLSKWDTEYSKFIDAKLQLLAALESYTDERVVTTVLPFLGDVNETARFHAVCTLLKQQDARISPALVEMSAKEESVRVRNKAREGF